MPSGASQGLEREPGAVGYPPQVPTPDPHGSTEVGEVGRRSAPCLLSGVDALPDETVVAGGDGGIEGGQLRGERLRSGPSTSTNGLLPSGTGGPVRRSRATLIEEDQVLRFEDGLDSRLPDPVTSVAIPGPPWR